MINNIWIKENFFSKLKNIFPDDNEIERRKQIIKLLNVKNEERLTRVYMTTDFILLGDVFEKFVEVSTKNLELIHYIVFLFVVIFYNVA